MAQVIWVQILLALEPTLSVTLLDEVTTGLDVLSRAELLQFLRSESEERGVTVVYATHVLDGLGDFATHLAFRSPGRLRFFDRLTAKTPLRERWMREERRQAAP